MLIKEKGYARQADNGAGERLGGGTLAMRKGNTKDKQRDTARGLYVAEHSLRASDATGNACAQHDEKSRREAEMHEFLLMRRSERVCSTR